MNQAPEVYSLDLSTPQSRRLLMDWEGFFSTNQDAFKEYPEAKLGLFVVVLLELYDQQCSRWVLLRRPCVRNGTAKWQFPSVAFNPGEMPLAAGLRALREQLLLGADNLDASWANETISVCGVGVDWLPTLTISLGTSLPAEIQNTLVFTYHARYRVADAQHLEIGDKVNPNNKVLLSGISDLEGLISDKAICPASQRLWQNYWAGVPVVT